MLVEDEEKPEVEIRIVGKERPTKKVESHAPNGQVVDEADVEHPGVKKDGQLQKEPATNEETIDQPLAEKEVKHDSTGRSSSSSEIIVPQVAVEEPEEVKFITPDDEETPREVNRVLKGPQGRKVYFVKGGTVVSGKFIRATTRGTRAPDYTSEEWASIGPEERYFAAREWNRANPDDAVAEPKVPAWKSEKKVDKKGDKKKKHMD